MLKYRLITSLILIPVVVILLFFLPIAEFSIVVLIICTLAMWEWVRLVGFTLPAQRFWLAALFGGLLLLIMLFLNNLNFNFKYSDYLTQFKWILLISLIWWIIAFILVLSYPFSASVWRNSFLIRLIFGLLIIVPFFSSTILLRKYNYEVNHFTGAWYMLYLMLLVWGADSGAYIVGKLLGYHKFAFKVSPSKTWEGFIGGLIIPGVISLVFSFFKPLQMSNLNLFICSLVTILAAILGDLTESMFKREAGVKDSSSLIPGHGGILDRIDSLTAATPIFTYFLLLF